jgi:hypothetical protein
MTSLSSLLLHLTHSANHSHYQSNMIRKNKDSRLNIRLNLIRDSTFIHNERDNHFKSSFKRERRDINSNDIYDFFSSLLSTRLFSIIISRRRENNVRDTHVMTNSIVSFFSHILVLRKQRRRRREWRRLERRKQERQKRRDNLTRKRFWKSK